MNFQKNELRHRTFINLFLLSCSNVRVLNAQALGNFMCQGDGSSSKAPQIFAI